jgi:hypothetical protein
MSSIALSTSTSTVRVAFFPSRHFLANEDTRPDLPEALQPNTTVSCGSNFRVWSGRNALTLRTCPTETSTRCSPLAATDGMSAAWVKHSSSG